MIGIFLLGTAGHKRIIFWTNIRKNHVYPGICLIRETHLDMQNPGFVKKQRPARFDPDQASSSQLKPQRAAHTNIWSSR
jgi:hypothetical protein